ncbi:hypothetical protein FJM65_04955 [Pontibacter mangrovi]|uniref:Uncharacterized protein n=1 Tax=Pontibacter mangrovi TaxID=2589816 RepID=A0A501WA85_9BACT|nr:hypothetical protein FJM65_04955 [Pontibacter mangrovi]
MYFKGVNVWLRHRAQPPLTISRNKSGIYDLSKEGNLELPFQKYKFHGWCCHQQKYKPTPSPSEEGN